MSSSFKPLSDADLLCNTGKFGDLKSSHGLASLDEYLADHSYVEGYSFTHTDLAVFEALAEAPRTETHNALRWYKHVQSFVVEAHSDANPAVMNLCEPAKVKFISIFG